MRRMTKVLISGMIHSELALRPLSEGFWQNKQFGNLVHQALGLLIRFFLLISKILQT